MEKYLKDRNLPSLLYFKQGILEIYVNYVIKRV